ncbi:alpha/beta hydrolase [Belnapia moabensis]|uniref:alpha/beta hydrolase n=1 Tax=Belnapia moabensis TaxID=365533 RepID=UPI0005B87959|nr:alpha/beta hydrolase [Belnapia moabensis]
MRRDIAFNAEGTTLRGWLYLPDNAGQHPTIVMAHGFTGVKEQYLDRYAEVFAAAGLAALVFDNRGFGASGGEPRQETDPFQQVRDYRHAITYARTLPELDENRVGAWGTSYSGGHVLMLGAIDRRVRCVVSQVPLISGPIGASRRARADLLPALLARFDADRDARFAGHPSAVIPVVAEDAAAACAMPGTEPWAFFSATQERAPAWRNEVTLRSAEMLREYEPGTWITRISPTPLLMIVATHDTLTPTDLALDAYNRALEPKSLVLIQGGHFEPYTGAGFQESSAVARDWFARHLL